ncbi:MAG: acyl-CoA synthetase FdrA, partial [Desulfobacterales bacterium]|nr:acyl-CoA synthetase FdrA [Desulfobacterales bacterium]
MAKKIIIKSNTYFDSVKLMSISKKISDITGVTQAVVTMGTDHNKETLHKVNLHTDETENASSSDLIIAVEAEEDLLDKVFSEIEMTLAKREIGNADEYRPRRLESAIEKLPGANLIIISVPGDYAKNEAMKALKLGLHVMLFSDNVSIEDEKELKDFASKKGLLLMGPDCGTAIINNVPLAFANVIRKGKIGIVAASGTGAQEVSTIIHKAGEGISQLIGTGGRDLSKIIGGSMMLRGLEALNEDPTTEVIILISKPAAEEVVEKVLAKVNKVEKPVVIIFLGGNPSTLENSINDSSKVFFATTLEDAAIMSVALLQGKEVHRVTEFTSDSSEIAEILVQETAKFNKKQKYLRGLFTGGTLADEAMGILEKRLGGIYSNIPFKKEYLLAKDFKSIKHTCIDLGDDLFTVGRPHPMIEPSTRVERLEEEILDEELAVLLLDIVLGFGSHPDPAGEILPVLHKAKKVATEKGGHLSIVASICGTEDDPQNLQEQKEKLEGVGVIVMPSNAQA